MRCLVQLAVLSLALALPLRAEEANLSSEPVGSPGAASMHILAHQTYVTAMAKGDPILLVASIRLARSVTMRPETSWERSTAGESTEEPPAELAPLPDPSSPEAIAVARALADEDPVLQDLVYDIDAQRPQGVIAAATQATAELGAGQTDTWRMPLSGEVPAEVVLIGGASSPLAMTVLDDTGQTICVAPPSLEATLCRFTPARNGFFSVVIRNTGNAWTRYRLVGN